MKLAIALAVGSMSSVLLAYQLRDVENNWSGVTVLVFAVSLVLFGHYSGKETMRDEIKRAFSHAIMNGKNREVMLIRPYFEERELLP